MSQFIVGLTGGIGSGKTTVSDLFASLGVTVVDADLIAREVVEPGSPVLHAIHQHFGDEVLNTNGELNRKWLRNAIFANPEHKVWLEQLMHPAIRESILEQLRETDSPYAMLSAPLLIENKLTQFCDRVLIVDLPPEMQLKRTAQRDETSEQQVRKIIDAQVSRKKRLEAADDIIDNSGSPDNLKGQVKKLHAQYLKFANSA